MKLKNIILAVSAVIAFTACSNNDDPDKGRTGKETLLSVKVQSAAVSAKADVDPNELEGEANINNLTIAVFNESGAKLVMDTKTLSGVSHEYTFNEIEVTKEGTAGRVKIVLIANAPAGAFNAVNDYAALEAVLADLANQKQDNLTMSTQVIETTTALPGGNNYIGYEGMENINGINEPLLLTRVPARLDVKSIRTNFTRPELVGRTVTVRQIYFENVKTKSRFFSAADWGVVQTDGNLDRTERPPYPVEVTEGNPWVNPYSKYVMENWEEGNVSDSTKVVVLARLEKSEEYEAESRYFRAVINENGKKKEPAYNHNLVRRNHVYKITLTFGDTAFDGKKIEEEPEPEDGYMDVQVEVVGWGPVSQEEEF